MAVRASTLALVIFTAGCSLGSLGGDSRAHATTAALAERHRPCPASDLSQVVQLVNDTRRRARLRLSRAGEFQEHTTFGVSGPGSDPDGFVADLAQRLQRGFAVTGDYGQLGLQ